MSMPNSCESVWMSNEPATRTTMSSLFSSYGSLSTPSGDKRMPLIKVPFDDLTSLMYTYVVSSEVHVLYLAALFPNLSMCPGQDFRVKVRITLSRYSLAVGLTSNFDLFVQYSSVEGPTL